MVDNRSHEDIIKQDIHVMAKNFCEKDYILQFLSMTIEHLGGTFWQMSKWSIISKTYAYIMIDGEASMPGISIGILTVFQGSQ